MTTIDVDLAVYSAETVLRTCHAFTARFHVSAAHSDAGRLSVTFGARDGSAVPPETAGEFMNALLDQQLRAIIAEETRPIRELLVAQAFCEADLLDRRDSESDEYADPRGIAR